MAIIDTANDLMTAIDEFNRVEQERKQHVSRVDAWFEQCRLRAVAQNPQAHADKGTPL